MNLESTATKVLDELENDTTRTPDGLTPEEPQLDAKELLRLYKKFQKKNSKKGTFNYRKNNSIPLKVRAKKYKAMRNNQKLARKNNRGIYSGR